MAVDAASTARTTSATQRSPTLASGLVSVGRTPERPMPVRPALRVAALSGGGLLLAYAFAAWVGCLALGLDGEPGNIGSQNGPLGSLLALGAIGIPWVALPSWHMLLARARLRGRTGATPRATDLALSLLALGICSAVVGFGFGWLCSPSLVDPQWLRVGVLGAAILSIGGWCVLGSGWAAVERRQKPRVVGRRVILTALFGAALVGCGLAVPRHGLLECGAAVLACVPLLLAIDTIPGLARADEQERVAMAGLGRATVFGLAVGGLLAAGQTVDRVVFWLFGREEFAPAHPLYESCLALGRLSAVPGLAWCAWLVRRDLLGSYRRWTMAEIVGRSPEQVERLRSRFESDARSVVSSWLRWQVVFTVVCLWLSPTILRSVGLSVGASAILQRVFVGALFEAGWLLALAALWLHNGRRAATWLAVWFVVLQAFGAIASTQLGVTTFGGGYALAAWVAFGTAGCVLVRAARASGGERWAR